MTWKDKLQKASFRGVEFHVETADTAIGRRNETHEYPLRDVPYTEDLGKKAREYSFRAYIIGDDYFSDRDALIKAIEDEGTAGTLVHPTLGSFKVHPRPCTVHFSKDEGGLEYFTLNFVEAGEQKFPSSGISAKSLISTKSIGLSSTFVEQFEKKFQVTGFIDDIANKAGSIIDQAVNVIDGVQQYGNFQIPYWSKFKGFVTKIKSSVTTLMSIPSQLTGAFKDLIGGVSLLYSDPKNIIVAQDKVFKFGDELVSVSQTTPTTVQQAINQEYVIDLVKGLAVAELAVAISNTEFKSRDEAVTTRDKVEEQFEELMIRTSDVLPNVDGRDQMYEAVLDLRTEVIRDINQRAIVLPALRSVKTQDAVPALVLAYDVYEDAGRDSEIIDRNRIRHPLFVPPHSDIEVVV